MLPDPFTIPASAPTPELVMSVVSPAPKLNGTIRIDASGLYKLTVTHEGIVTPSKNGVRHVVRLEEAKDVTDPNTGLTRRASAFVAVTFQFPVGWTNAQKAALYKAVVDTIADPEVTVAKILQGLA